VGFVLQTLKIALDAILLRSFVESE